MPLPVFLRSAVLLSVLAASCDLDRGVPTTGESTRAAAASDSIAASGTVSTALPDTGGGAGARAASDALITGADGVAFGTSRDAIVAMKGAPVFEKEDFEGVREVVYPGRLMGQEVQTMFFVHPRHGMVRAGFAAMVRDAGQCQFVLRMWEHALEQKYAALRPDRRVPTGTACRELDQRNRMWMEIRTDPSDGHRIMLALIPGTPGVMLTYTTPRAEAWEKRKNDSQF
jgi:hypothetical protein